MNIGIIGAGHIGSALAVRLTSLGHTVYIAATALAHNLLLLTRNTSDFSAVAGLQVLNPHGSAQLSQL